MINKLRGSPKNIVSLSSLLPLDPFFIFGIFKYPDDSFCSTFHIYALTCKPFGYRTDEKKCIQECLSASLFTKVMLLGTHLRWHDLKLTRSQKILAPCLFWKSMSTLSWNISSNHSCSSFRLSRVDVKYVMLETNRRICLSALCGLGVFI